MTFKDLQIALWWDCSCRRGWHPGDRPAGWDGRCPFNSGIALVAFIVQDAYSRRVAYDPNLHWAKVTVVRLEDVERVHAAISAGLGRTSLRPPVENEIVVEFWDMNRDEGADVVRSVIGAELADLDGIQVEAGDGNRLWIYGPYPEVGQRHLHDVMLDLVPARPSGMTPVEISEGVTQGGLYVGPRSNRVPEPKQISARASNRRDLFEVVDGRIRARDARADS